MGNVALIPIFGAITLLAVVAAAFARDGAFATHMWLLAAMCVAVVVVNARSLNWNAAGKLVAPEPDESGYVDGPIRAGVIATVFWGVAGFTVGVLIAFQLAFPDLNLEPWFNFGRMRPLHTSAVIFAFGGSILVATTMHVVQRTCRARLFGGETLGWFIFWGYQIFIVLAATGYLMGVTQSKEYAEPEWYVDIWLTIVWVAFLVVVPRHAGEAAGAAHLCGELVLPRLHRDHRDAARRQQPRDPGVVVRLQVVHRLLGRAGCADAVVVRP